MKNFLQKKMNKKGFTLAELLIVVAIIGVLVAVSIPIFSTQLEKSRENTDVANLRAAKAAAIAMFLDDNESTGRYYYDAEMGGLVTRAMTEADGYGKGNTKIGDKKISFKMSTEPASVMNSKANTDVSHRQAYGRHINSAQKAADAGMGLEVSVSEGFDGFYKADDEVRDCIIHVGIASNDGALDTANAQDYIYLEWLLPSTTDTPAIINTIKPLAP